MQSRMRRSGGMTGTYFVTAPRDPVVLAQAVHRVVVVETEEEDVAGAEGIALADELERVRRVRGEDGNVFVGGGVEKLEDAVAASLDVVGRNGRGRVRGMRDCPRTCARRNSA